MLKRNQESGDTPCESELAIEYGYNVTMLIQRGMFKCGYLYPEIKSIKSETLTV